MRKKAKRGPQINARAETLLESPMLRHPAISRRCLIPADGFYEWTSATGSRPSQPLHIRLKGGGLFAFAGIYAGRRDGLDTYAIVTTEPNELVAPIHNRMPVMLDPDDEALWLDSAVTTHRLCWATCDRTSLRRWRRTPSARWSRRPGTRAASRSSRSACHSRVCARCSLSPRPLRAGGRFGRLGRLRWLGWLRQVRLDQLLDRLGQLHLLQPLPGDVLALRHDPVAEGAACGGRSGAHLETAAALVGNVQPT